MKSSWLNIPITHPKLVLILGFLVIVASALGAKNLYFRGDYKVFFEDENPQRVAFENMQNIFSKNDNASIIIAPKSGDVFTKETLILIQELTEEAWQTPMSTRVDSLTNFQHTWAEYDDLLVDDLVLEPASISDSEIEKVRNIALQEPNLLVRTVSENSQVTSINITVNLPDGDQTSEVLAIAEFVKNMTDSFKQKYPNHDFYHTGVVFMNNAFADSAKQDATTLIPLMFVVILLIMAVLLATVSGTFATLIVITASIVSTMGLAGWFGLFLSTATVNVPTIVMTLAVADCIHIIATMMFSMGQGKDKTEALLYSVRLNVKPILITSVTTAIGFLTLNFSDVPILADLGNLTALGVLFACLFSLSILPAMIMLLPIKQATKQANELGMIEKLGEWVIGHHKKLLPLCLIVTSLAVGFSFKNQLNDVPTEYFDTTSEFRQSTDFQEQNLSGMSTVDYVISTGIDSGINIPEILVIVERFSEWLREQPEVDHVSSISDTYKRLNKNMNNDDMAFYTLPDDRELAAQYLLMYEFSLPYGLDLTNQLDLNKSSTRIMTTIKNLGSKEITEFERRAQRWFEENATDLTLTAGSPNLMFAHIGEANMQSMLKGSVVALILISGLLIFALKSWRLGLISLLPNLLPACIGFGIWGLYSAEVNLGLSVVLSMTLGIIVDDTVHFLTKYDYARKSGEDAINSIRYAFASVGKALWITTLVLAAGFSVLTLSSFAINSEMGLLTSIIIVVALAVDFLFLPAFIMVFDSKKDKSSASKFS
ncbi:efflux RND transporter permease subunit [Paraglaciecola sp. 2405UD69-4]|uniref:efflux RND transporter permease subunit n=1 Tax=Paraglaciecola sp. 2405UD69-4 TaxID=3391836 RepID=UPI0039C906D7